MIQPIYTLERWPHGWLLCGYDGVPVSALSEVLGLFDDAGSPAIIDNGIAHHYRQNKAQGIGPEVVAAIATPEESTAWRAEITEKLKSCSPEVAWWLGFDVGLSSGAIFGVLCSSVPLAYKANMQSRKATPRDAHDFGRCMRLIERFPEWRARLGEVAAAYPDTAWPQIIARWDDLVAADDATRSKILVDGESEE